MNPVRLLVAGWRLLRLVGHLFRGLWTLYTVFDSRPEAWRQECVRRWSRDAVRILGVQIESFGDVPDAGPLLVASNHVSWLDILVINAVRPCRFVSKADVRGWPALGKLVEGAGTLFIERERPRDAVRVAHHLAEHLRAGDVLAVFPEGTTSDGRTVLPFHANLLQAAIVVDAPALPVALSYVHGQSGDLHAAPVYVGDTSLLGSICATVLAKDLVARIEFGGPDRADGRDRRRWAHDLRERVICLQSARKGAPTS